MTKSLRNIGISLFTAIFVLLQSNVVLAHGGEDHGDEKEQPAAAVVNIQNTGSKILKSDKLEVMIKYPELHSNVVAPFQIFITEFQSNKPINNANVSFYFESEDSNINPIKLQALESNTPGVYQSQIKFEKSSDYRMLLGINKGDLDESFSIETLHVENLVTPLTEDKTFSKNWLLPLLILLILILSITAIYLFNTKTQNLRLKDAG